MPEAIKYDIGDQDVRKAADKEIKARLAVRDKAAAWYDNEIPDVLTVKRNKKGVSIDNNVKLNLFKKRLERRRDFLFKYFPLLDLDDSQDESEEEKWLRAAWNWNKSATLWGLSVLNGGFSGQVYMRIMPPRPKRDKYPRAILLSNVITVWQADDVDTALWYEVHYNVGKDFYRQDIVDLSLAENGPEEWAVYTYSKKGELGAWDLIKEDTWEYPLGPIVSWQHWPRAGRCYGAGEFDDIELNTSINRIMSLGNAVIRNHAFPKTVVTGAAGQEPQESAVDGMWTLPKDAEVFNLEMQSDLSAILSYVDRLTADYNTQGRTVDVAGGPADFSSITNLAIKVSFMPQDDANEILKRQYGSAIIEASKRLQMVDGRPYEVDPKINWRPALPESQTEMAQVVTAEDTLKLASKETQTTQMGLDYQKEQRRMEDEAADAQVDQGGPTAFTPDQQAQYLEFYQRMKGMSGGQDTGNMMNQGSNGGSGG